jgi:hypothetical protein
VVHPDPAWQAFVVSILTSLPAILLGLAALVRAIRAQATADSVDQRTNGHAADLTRRLIQDAFGEGRRAGYAEHKALTEVPPQKPPQL